MKLHTAIAMVLLASTSLTTQAQSAETSSSLTLNNGAGSLTFTAAPVTDPADGSGVIPVSPTQATGTSSSGSRTVSNIRFDLANHRVIGDVTDSTGLQRDVTLWTTDITGPTTISPANLPAGYSVYAPALGGNAIPEPATWALMGLGLAGVALATARRRV